MALVMVFGLSVSARATLIDMGDGTIYDTDLQLSWLQNANTNGLMNWSQANTWADNLVFATFDNWRLPTTLQPDATCSGQSGGDSYGYNCTGSEMGHLFYTELGGVARTSIATTHNANYNLFQNVQSDSYWSGTVYAPYIYYVWSFDFYDGNQLMGIKGNPFYAWAVRPGDVAAVPLPAATWLFGSGLLGLIGVARRKARA